MDEFHRSESIDVDASTDHLYDLVTDIGRTGEWSPVCTGCQWRDGDGPREGAWFDGRNEADGRVWQTESLVEVAQPGREFTWLVGGKYARWGFRLEALGPERTRLTESWEFLPAGRAMFREKYGDAADERVALRQRQAATGIPETLAAIKRLAEAGSGTG